MAIGGIQNRMITPNNILKQPNNIFIRNILAQNINQDLMVDTSKKLLDVAF